MTIEIAFGWWLAPASATVALVGGWRLFGVRMKPQGGGMFPDTVGALVELGGYLTAFLLSVIAWLVWALVA